MLLTSVLEVKSKNGLHTRPAGILCNIANKQKYADLGVFMMHEGVRVDVKSILNVLTLGAVHGSKIVLEVDGPDEQKGVMEDAIEEIQQFFESEFKIVQEEDEA